MLFPKRQNHKILNDILLVYWGFKYFFLPLPQIYTYYSFSFGFFFRFWAFKVNHYFWIIMNSQFSLSVFYIMCQLKFIKNEIKRQSVVVWRRMKVNRVVKIKENKEGRYRFFEKITTAMIPKMSAALRFTIK